MYTSLIEPADLASRTAAPDWAVLDCRFELTRPDWGAAAYSEGHIPQAIYAHLERDLSSPVTATSGRHPLPSVESLVQTFGRWGIDSTVQVVAYDQGNGAYAARLWWLLRWMGHKRVAVLNGGLAAWRQANLPLSTQPGVRPARQFATDTGGATADPSATADSDSAGADRNATAGSVAPAIAEGSWRRPAVISTAEVQKLVAAGKLTGAGPDTLIDARSADRFAGRNESIDPVAGHIPGARNHPFTQNLDAQGRFLPPETLRTRWLETLNGKPSAEVISSCGSGVTACHNLLALEVAGLPGGRLYAGSWSEWIRDAARGAG